MKQFLVTDIARIQYKDLKSVTSTKMKYTYDSMLSDEKNTEGLICLTSNYNTI